ncbi:MAG: SUMF1/EgtB/PvdO family nonheme iron enzyme [Burkholderiaceae bacterium]
MPGNELADLNSPRLRQAGKGLLSLALIDARNRTLRWIGAFETVLGNPRLEFEARPDANPLLWELGHIGWFQEHWIARNVQRQRGEACDATRPKLASILPDADRCFDPASTARASRWALALPDLQTTRQYLVDTLETSLELLEAASEDDAGLYFYRLALFSEDARIEAFAVLAQVLGVDTGLLAAPPSVAARPPLLFPATRFRLGAEPGGFVFDNQKWAFEEAVLEFEIDAQAVNWSQYAEFVEDGGYDERGHWSEAGWAWVQATGRRVPRYVDQLRQGVLQQRFGKLLRLPMAQPVTHVSWFEADAWCRWAGRRLPAEVEWEAAACLGVTRGFRWGDVREWTASTMRPYPGFVSGPTAAPPSPEFGAGKVQRGASFATVGRLRGERDRHFDAPKNDQGFVGFRSCAA